MSAHIAVVTDSTSCLPEHLAAQWRINVVQVQLHVGDQTDDEHRFDRSELIQTMKSGAAVTTSPPDPGAFFWSYQDAASAGASAIVSLHISGRLSQTVEAAREAAQQVRIPVHILDSGTASMSLGYAAVSAARVAGAGGQLERVLDAAERRVRSSTELIYVDTLEYLRRSGRIGAAQSMLGSAFAIKPLLTVRNGEVSPLARVPGTKRAMNRLVDLAVKAAGDQPVDLAVTRFGSDENEIVRRLRERVPGAGEIVVGDASTVIGAHVGPGALSITVSPSN
ncbi:DegV family protein [Amycolatopsis rubida]|uniref:DegV family protein n=1 Tax=Amycolatopsis rubida TaxID=112413 RepID=A0ABX0BY21_9PSEU|nr:MULTISPECIES: DegV family protein [Amycolatopsis]MYW92715.1 DegV family EDD domain-containing protein [Amycolatopsis rubida]NEC57700.1 DegV family protein [Amycolatopsis rubida]OAP24860.1 DegV domain-containing protein [Amycolatopsis sp. M39]